jgi:4-amino-4-deoxy-L-arabinose transferase-like glycosyltransferase
MQAMVSSFKMVFAENKAFIGFASIWVLSIIGMTAMVSTFYERYLLPVTPVASIILAGILIKTQLSSTNTMQLWIRIFIGLNWLVLAVALFAHIGLGSSVWIYGQWIIGFGLSLWLWRKINVPEFRLQVLGLSILLLFFSISLVTNPLSIPNQGRQVQAYVNTHKIPENSKIAFLGNLHYASKIRIGLGPKYNMKTFSSPDKIPEDYLYIICDEPNRKTLEGRLSSTTEVISLNWDPKYIKEMILAIIEGNTTEEKIKWGKKYYWVDQSPT